jgi:medium-chain acyl-[acyl-carrier-protein] hydrolase
VLDLQVVSGYRSRFEVRAYECDATGRLATRYLCAFLQETAACHAQRVGYANEHLGQGGLAWVLHRLRVAVETWPRAGERVSVETWAPLFETALAHREYLVEREAGGVIARATSRWVMLSLATRRLVRLPAEIRALPLPERPRALAGELETLEPLEAAESERRFEVRRSDVDAFAHVNNTRYAEWVLESVPEATFESAEPRLFDLVFRKEAGYGEAVLARSTRDGGPHRFRHALVAAADGRELVRAVSEWAERPR